MALINLTPQAFTCTPSSLLDSVPCLKCLSEKELLAGILSIFLEEADEDADTALKEAACFNCMSRKQMLEGLTVLLGNNLLGEDFDPASLAAKFNCLRCTSDQQLLAAILYMLCGYLNREQQG